MLNFLLNDSIGSISTIIIIVLVIGISSVSILFFISVLPTKEEKYLFVLGNIMVSSCIAVLLVVIPTYSPTYSTQHIVQQQDILKYVLNENTTENELRTFVKDNMVGKNKDEITSLLESIEKRVVIEMEKITNNKIRLTLHEKNEIVRYYNSIVDDYNNQIVEKK